MIAVTHEAKLKLTNAKSSGVHHSDVFLCPAPYIGNLPKVQCDVLMVEMPKGNKQVR